MAKLAEIEGIGKSLSSKFEEQGISTVESLLEKCCTTTGRKEIAEKTGISEKRILRWVNMADLFRVKGIGEEYADLLEAAGVDTVPELAQRNAKNLAERMAAVNQEKKLVRAVPPESRVSEWIEQAKVLPRKVEY
ncbi:MAG TPA: DUF4332 domain-containing protein [candidate division Zixibacteria bacterium]|nr:DUF4332 domain-containing protein [candidate division Zixibacteria bacterium]HER00442.1 DUF4332 domain-containing protein [candidate division Zixibacteria bacterium]